MTKPELGSCTRKMHRRGLVAPIVAGAVVILVPGCFALVPDFEFAPLTSPDAAFPPPSDDAADIPDATDATDATDTTDTTDARDSSTTHPGKEDSGDAGTTDAVAWVDAAVDASCDARIVPGIGVFVSADGDDQAGDGTAILPYRTISAAVKAAVVSSKPNIFVAEGTYPEALLFDANHDGVAISGGWLRRGSAWTLDCVADARARTLIASTSNIAVLLTTTTQPITLERLTIATKAACASAPDTSGDSCVGIYATGDSVSLRLVNVRVLAGRGGAGGAARPARAAGNVACDTAASCRSSAPKTGSVGAPGAPTRLPGTIGGADGFTPADGDDGKRGGDGENGTAGGQGAAITCADVGAGQCALPFSTCIQRIVPVGSAGPGQCGCGGLGGEGGGRGRGGGASVALEVTGARAKVSLVGSVLETVGAGDGSEGARGGPPGFGSPGESGISRTCPQSNVPSRPSSDPACVCIGANNKTFPGGLAGGSGAQGGAGGQGGAGAGGWSVGYIATNAGAVTRDSATTIVVGSAGKGGTGAPSGVFAEKFP
jgi:hypothetical protein